MPELEQKEVDRLFPPYDPQSVSDALEVERRGRDDGSHNRPPATATAPSGVESEVTAHFEGIVDNAATSTRAMLDRLREQRRQLDVDSLIEDARHLPTKLRKEIANLKARHKAHLKELRDREREQRANLEAFKNEHKLSRAARRKENPVTFVVIILLFVAVETALNATFFAMGSEFGYLGGMIEAIVISGMNVGVAVLVGLWGAPYVNHRAFSKKAWGCLSLLIWIAFVVGLNVFAGHYRSALVQSPLEAVTQAVVTIQDSFFGIETTQGWLLCAIGVLASVAVLAKVYFSDDPYPGYSKVSLAYDRAKENWRNAQSDFVAELKKLHDQIEDERKEAHVAMKRAAAKYERYVRDTEILLRRYEDYRKRARGWCAAVLDLYRAANIAVRQDPLPEYFRNAQGISFDHLSLAEDLAEDVTELREMKEKIKRFAEAEAGELRQTLSGVYEKEIEKLDTFYHDFSLT